MNRNEFAYERDDDGIVTVTMDMAGQSANTMTPEFGRLMSGTLGRLKQESKLSGVVLASAKKSFFAGGDLKEMLDSTRSAEEDFRYLEATKDHLYQLETLPVPVVAAINGAALGGGYEICLACNYRVALDAPGVVVGLPEVTLGLLPAGGGVVRLTAKLGLEKALPILLEGKSYAAADAKAMGLVDELVSQAAGLIPAAKAWIKANPGAGTQPWHRKGFSYPNGDATGMTVRQVAAIAPTRLFAKTRGLVPAPAKILDIAVNSMRMGFESALRAESRAFVSLLRTPAARAQITTFFLHMNGISKNVYRPPGDTRKVMSSAVLGAGMMGRGIAWAHASRGLAVLLKDVTLEGARRGKDHAAGIADRQIKQQRLREDKKQTILGAITPIASYGDIKNVDLIVEAVFEDIAVKEKVLPESFGCLSESGIYGSNTSTIPIGLLAKHVPDASRFIGLHFFSPVERMQLVEIIRGVETSDATAAMAYDYVKQIGKTPIIVNDGRGFFTSRVFGTYTDEGAALLRDGVSAVRIEREAWKTGMPVGPLAVTDEVSLVLQKKILDTHDAIDRSLGVSGGYPAEMTSTRAVSLRMIELGRGGRHYGGGYYDYSADGKKVLWKGLEQFSGGKANDLSAADIRDRLLFRLVIETLRCFHEGVLRSEAEANIGSIFAFGFPAHTGGALQFITWYGFDAFVKRSGELAARFGVRFAVLPSMLDKLQAGRPL